MKSKALRTNHYRNAEAYDWQINIWSNGRALILNLQENLARPLLANSESELIIQRDGIA